MELKEIIHGLSNIRTSGLSKDSDSVLLEAENTLSDYRNNLDSFNWITNIVSLEKKELVKSETIGTQRIILNYKDGSGPKIELLLTHHKDIMLKQGKDIIFYDMDEIDVLISALEQMKKLVSISNNPK